jgi:hypothetical protein
MDIPMKEIRLRFEVWEESDSDTMVSAEQARAMKADGSMERDAGMIHVIEAATPEEARAIWNLRRGYAPYLPAGESQPCPRGCGSHYYPESSGACPYCGPVS